MAQMDVGSLASFTDSPVVFGNEYYLDLLVPFICTPTLAHGPDPIPRPASAVDNSLIHASPSFTDCIV